MVGEGKVRKMKFNAAADLIHVVLEGVDTLPCTGIPDLHCLITRPAVGGCWGGGL